MYADKKDTATFKATTQTRELAWGGEPCLNTSFAFRLCSQFTVAHKLPDTREEVICSVIT